ncbi:MAG: biotin/lipoyl-binding protein [Veillonella sp.]
MKVLVKENDQVTAGQVIAYIDTRQLHLLMMLVQR